MKTKIGVGLLSLILLFALLGPEISGYTYYDIQLEEQNLAPSWKHLLGTDDLGRDVFTRAAFGARISLFVGVSAAIIDLMIGVIWGGVAAFSGRFIDALMMRIADVLYSLPYLLVVILLMMLLGPGLLSIIAALSLIGWITMARIVRAQIVELKTQEYVLAAKTLGAGFFRILFTHLIPNAAGPIIVTLTLTIPSAIFAEAFLSFLGLGVQAPVASLGTMASEGLPALAYYPWRLFVPASIISLTIFSFHLIVEGMRTKDESYVPTA